MTSPYRTTQAQYVKPRRACAVAHARRFETVPQAVRARSGGPRRVPLDATVCGRVITPTWIGASRIEYRDVGCGACLAIEGRRRAAARSAP